MPKRKLLLTFPANLVGKPLTYHLVRDYDLEINILRARVTPNEEGRLIVELNGRKDNIKLGEAYLEAIGVRVKPLALDITYHQDRCIHCTACSAVCRSGAITEHRDSMKMDLNKEKCIACELCVSACPFNAMEIEF